MKKTLAVVMAFVLVIAMSVAGTFAYLTAETGKVTNTFTAGKILDDPKNDFKLEEHGVVANDDGTYKQGENIVTEVSYTVKPGVNLPKDPFVTVKNSDIAYLFITVEDKLPTGLSWNVDSAWEKLMDGEEQVMLNGKPVWVWKSAEGGNVLAAQEAPLTVNVIANKTITVPGDFNVETMTDNTLSFQAYLAQASGVASALEAWNANFVPKAA